MRRGPDGLCYLGVDTQSCNIAITHWGRVMLICVSRLTITGSDNGLLPGRHQAIIWTNAGILLIGALGTNFSENSIEILTFLFTKLRLKVSSAKWRPFCLGLNVIRYRCDDKITLRASNVNFFFFLLWIRMQLSLHWPYQWFRAILSYLIIVLNNGLAMSSCSQS